MTLLQRIKEKPAGWVSDLLAPAALIALFSGAYYLGDMRSDLDVTTDAVQGVRTDLSELNAVVAGEQRADADLRGRVDILIRMLERRADFFSPSERPYTGPVTPQ